MRREIFVNVTMREDDSKIALPTSKIHLINDHPDDMGAIIIGNFKYPELGINGQVEVNEPFQDVVDMCNGAKVKVEHKVVSTTIESIMPNDIHAMPIDSPKDLDAHSHKVDLLIAKGWEVIDVDEKPAPSSAAHKYSKILETTLERKVVERD